MTQQHPSNRPDLALRTRALPARKAHANLLGINLGAFGIAGGLVVTLMGFEMLFGGEPSRAQGGEAAHEEPKSFEGSVNVLYAIPFVAGPGAITLVITLASSKPGGEGIIAALVAVAVSVILLPIGHLVISNHVRLSESTIGIATKFGGLLIATIGIQLMLNGIKTFLASAEPVRSVGDPVRDAAFIARLHCVVKSGRLIEPSPRDPRCVPTCSPATPPALTR